MSSPLPAQPARSQLQGLPAADRAWSSPLCGAQGWGPQLALGKPHPRSPRISASTSAAHGGKPHTTAEPRGRARDRSGSRNLCPVQGHRALAAGSLPISKLSPLRASRWRCGAAGTCLPGLRRPREAGRGSQEWHPRGCVLPAGAHKHSAWEGVQRRGTKAGEIVPLKIFKEMIQVPVLKPGPART